MPTVPPCRHLRRVYCAGPLFNDAERREMGRIGQVLREAGFEPFLPHADGMEFAQVRPYMIAQGFDPKATGQLLHTAIFALDVYQVVVGCGSLVFNMNGRVPDEGAVAEATMAWMLGKPVVMFKEDARSAICGRDNPIIAGQCDFTTVSDIHALGQALSERIAMLAERELLPYPAHLKKTVDAGGRLWAALLTMGANRDSDTVAEVVLELFGRPRQAVG